MKTSIQSAFKFASASSLAFILAGCAGNFIPPSGVIYNVPVNPSSGVVYNVPANPSSGAVYHVPARASSGVVYNVAA